MYMYIIYLYYIYIYLSLPLNDHDLPAWNAVINCRDLIPYKLLRLWVQINQWTKTNVHTKLWMNYWLLQTKKQQDYD